MKVLDKFKHGLVIGIVFSVLSLSALHADETKLKSSFSLKEVRDFAVKNSLATRNARLDVRRAKNVVWETTTEGLPQIDGKISYTNNLKMPTTLIPAQVFNPEAKPGEFMEAQFGTKHNATADITVSQLIFRGSYIVALQSTKVYMQISRNSLKKQEIDVKDLVTGTYYAILMGEKTLETYRNTLKNLNKLLGDSSELSKEGFVEETEVDQMRITANEMSSAISTLERNLDIYRRTLNFQMGRELNSKLVLTDSIDTIMNGIDKAILLNDPVNPESHIDLIIATNKVETERLLFKNEKTKFLPEITAFFSHSRSAMRDKFNFFGSGKWFPSSVLGLNIKVPIFSSGKRLAKVKQAKYNYEKAKNERKELDKNLRLSLIRARSEFKDFMDKVQTTSDNLELAKRIYMRTELKFREGLVDSLKLTQIHNQFIDADAKHTGAVIELLRSGTALEKLMSRL